MKITIISMWYNEAMIAPYFLGHYSFADKILIGLEATSSDSTLALLEKTKNVEIEELRFPDGIDDDLKIGAFNGMIANQDCDWVYAVDSDEFLFPQRRMDHRLVLSNQGDANLVWADMWNVHRHLSDSDLDPAMPAASQRRHGAAQIHHGKPVICRPNAGLVLGPGQHTYAANPGIIVSPDRFHGVHWQMVDAEMSIDRLIRGRRDRMSQHNIEKGYGSHNFACTEEQIRKECVEHLEDPLLFGQYMELLFPYSRDIA